MRGLRSLAFQGQYENDLRTGLWTFYDEQGREIERGNFVADRRDGEWTIRDPGKVSERRTTYIAGRTQADHAKLLASIQADLATTSIRRQVAAIARLEELGPHGWPLLAELLDRDSLDLKLLALRTFVRQASFPAASSKKIEALIEHPDERLAVRAMTAIYIAQPERRSELYEELLAAITPHDPRGIFVETIQAMYRSDELRRAELVQAVIARLAPQMPVSDSPYGWNVYGENCLADLGQSVIPHLDAAFQSTKVQERLFVVLVLQHLVKECPIERPTVSPPGGVPRHKIPTAAQPLLDRALADPDPLVQEAAKRVGLWNLGFGSFGFGSGQGGGYF